MTWQPPGNDSLTVIFSRSDYFPPKRVMARLPTSPNCMIMTTNPISEANIHEFLKARIATETHTTPDRIDIHTPLTTYRLDSVVTVTLAVDLEEWLNASFDPSIFWEFATIADLSAWLVNDYLPNQS